MQDRLAEAPAGSRSEAFERRKEEATPPFFNSPLTFAAKLSPFREANRAFVSNENSLSSIP